MVPKFLVQFGISYSKDKELQRYAKTQIPDDPSLGKSFHPGMISFAGSGDNSRTSQLFISYGSAKSLGKQKWETALGEVIEGMENVEKFYSYGDMPPWGEGPQQQKIHGHPEYIEENFPKTDKFNHCKVERLGTKVSELQLFLVFNLDSNDTLLADMPLPIYDVRILEKIDIPEKTVTRKGDKTTDEEEFHKQRADRLASPDKMAARELMGSSVDVIGGGLAVPVIFVALGMLLIGTVAFRGGKKLRSKSN